MPIWVAIGDSKTSLCYRGSHMPSIVFNANAPLKDRNGIVKRDPKQGA